jgi:RNA polymerase sigma-70 factor (ECF subfamily)
MATFFRHYFGQVYGLVLRLLGERAAAEDVTQEVFYKVYRAAQQLDPARDPGPWLTAIAYNACRDLWRSAAHRMSRRSGSIDDDPTIDARLSSGADEPERNALAKERERLVQEAILRLPEQLRTAIVLYDYQGLSHQEVAAITGIHHAAARKRYSRALAALAAMLKDSLG